MIKCVTHKINLHAGVSSAAGGLTFGMRLHLHPSFVYASREGFGKHMHIFRRIVCAFTAYPGQNDLKSVKYVLDKLF